MNLSWKDKVETHWLSDKGKVLGAVIIKEGHAGNFRGH